MLGHAVLQVALALLAQALMIAIGVTTRWLVVPFEIEATLRRSWSWSTRAERYGGPVRLVVSDDGSLDSTEEIATREVARLRFARGSVLTGPNGRQSAALNRALAITKLALIPRYLPDRPALPPR
jgi:hypothetical protein